MAMKKRSHKKEAKKKGKGMMEEVKTGAKDTWGEVKEKAEDVRDKMR